jgi:hypothetical protein
MQTTDAAAEWADVHFAHDPYPTIGCRTALTAYEESLISRPVQRIGAAVHEFRPHLPPYAGAAWP